MASTYSTSLKLELMATGDQTGTWGVTNNKNLGTLLEQAITGVLSVAQGDVANLTLTSLDGASDQARNAVINLTGAMTAGRNVIVPTANKVYLVKNSTTGGFAVTVKTAAGSGVAIANGTAQWVYCDGTNVVQGLSGTLASQAAAAVAITGGTITGLTSLGASGVALTSGTVTGLTSLTLASGAATPATNDAAALGSSTLMWSDLFLASGGVINFNNGNWVATHTSGILTVGTGDLRITTAGTNAASVVTVGGTQTLTSKTLTTPTMTGPVVTTTEIDLQVGQIKFPATQNPSANANTLDDYEEGTFTPAFSASGCTFSYASQYGAYTKIGDRVFVTLRIELNTTGNTLTSSNISITGLPFPIGESQAQSFPVRWSQATSSFIAVIAVGTAGASTLSIFGNTAAAASLGSAVNANAILSATAGSVISVNSMHYKV